MNQRTLMMVGLYLAVSAAGWWLAGASASPAQAAAAAQMCGGGCCGDQPAAPAAPAPADQKAGYTCPMHPEVQSDQPGDCPKCGMKLVKKTK